MGNKRKISILIPYRLTEGEILVYLQKRSKDMKRLPDYFGFFGGGAKRNENPEEALKREIKEEMDFVLTEFNYFRQYEFEKSLKDIFTIKADNNFENRIKILEGDYGQWFNQQEALSEPKLIEEDKIVLRDLYEFLWTQE